MLRAETGPMPRMTVAITQPSHACALSITIPSRRSLPFQQHVAAQNRSDAIGELPRARRPHHGIHVARVPVIGDVENLSADISGALPDSERLVDHHVGRHEAWKRAAVG